jgi:hypothetical protein
VTYVQDTFYWKANSERREKAGLVARSSVKAGSKDGEPVFNEEKSIKNGDGTVEVRSGQGVDVEVTQRPYLPAEIS